MVGLYESGLGSGRTLRYVSGRSWAQNVEFANKRHLFSFSRNHQLYTTRAKSGEFALIDVYCFYYVMLFFLAVTTVYLAQQASKFI